MNDVWVLESDTEIMAGDDLSRIADFAIAGHRKSQNYLKKLWQESWQTIKEKLETEGSAWYVWWMDGVYSHIHDLAHREFGEA